MKYKNRGLPAYFSVIFLFFQALSLFSADFSEINLSQDNRLLFKAEFESQTAAFIASLDDLSIQQLTAYPEKLQIIDNGRSILVINRFGISRISAAGGLPEAISGHPSFVNGRMPLKGRLMDAVASNDGRWIVYIDPVSPAYGNLYILDTATGTTQIVSERIELPGRDFPVKWSSDSRLFVYSKNLKLYYFPIVSDLSVLVDERFRLIGPGGINSVVWGQQGDFYYFLQNTLYRIRNPELFTRTIYGDFLSIGQAVLNIPFDFDSGIDRFWIAPDSNAILINKNNRGMYFYLLDQNSINISLPHYLIPYGNSNLQVLWSPSGKVSVFYSVNGSITAFHHEISGNNITSSQSDAVPLSSGGILSPDGSKAVFWGEHGLELWDYNNWRLIQKISSDPFLSCAWISNDRFIAGNSRFITEINISSTGVTQRRICISAADETAYELTDRGQSRVLARLGQDWFATDTRNAWTPASSPQRRPVSAATERYRIFLDSGNIMIRNLQSFGTVSLLAGHTANSAYTQRNIRVALCFDLYDDDSGLYYVLEALRRNNIRATFFLNGEFVRRNPAAAKAIADSGNETGSMFFAPVDFSDSRYRITHEFIVQGLARNEDEFFNTTGKELSLLWHPPFYRTSDLITSAAASSGYTSITRTLDIMDWLSREESARLNLRYISPSEMIEQITRQGSANAVIPIRLGTLAGGRDEYLFYRIDVLLDALARSGIQVVPVSQVTGNR